MSLTGIKFEPEQFKVKDNSPIAQGGFGEVWDAWHDRLERVAIKILSQQVSIR